MKQLTILTAAVLLLITGFSVNSETKLFAKSNSPVWTDINESEIDLNGERRIIPQKYRTVLTNFTQLSELLRTAPFEFSDRAKNDPFIMELPMPDGSMSKFEITEYSMMEPGLAEKFPEIKTYNAKGIDDPYATGKLDITYHGFHAMILSVKGDYFIDPYSTNEKNVYISYFKKDYVSNKSFDCMTEDDPESLLRAKDLMRGGIVSGPELRTYRTAVAATGEYTAFHGGTVPLGLAAIVTAMNRVTGVYEKEFSVRMVLIANNDLIVYTNGTTDPYSNNNGGTMLGQNQTNLDNVIGNANYDVGHVFSTGGGGVAGLRVVCITGQKARGVTGLPQPIGDPFYIDYVAHEIGHQYGGNHSFNSQSSGCGGGNRNGNTAYEPGSGSTIMAYAGLCGSDNLQSFSDPYFHTISFLEIVSYTQNSGGNTCALITPTGNTPPVVTVPAGGLTIPINTPIALTGSATDAENQNSLTYCWEQYDLGPAGTLANPTGNAPIIRSFNPDTSSTRYIPRISNLINNTFATGERLPSYARTLSFRLTVRDNNIAGGGVNYEFVSYEVTAGAGPFLVTQPNTNVTWNSNNPQTVTWDVANTNAAPVSVSNVNIKLSTDGGLTFPTTLAANTSNDGSETITLPSINISNARIKVEAVGNIFFDISNVNFAISNQVSVLNNNTGIPSEYSLSQNFPNPFNPSTKINFDIPENSDVTLKLMDISGREIATLVRDNFTAGSYSFSFDGRGLSSGVYFYKLEAGEFFQTKRMVLIK
ncbi:MAG TPA: M12 family metallo-peptidase [Ignavibacteria bacterium]|nr:M12 family metallo-peptidase [Ignavibacteria bacterium]HRJ99438.1 M12 family metallo-peptidase [Ignavibacteria bacterium]